MVYEITNLNSEIGYRTLFATLYCDSSNPIYTFDGIKVRFFPDRFDDAFFKSVNWTIKDKSIFSLDRAKKVTWIKDALLDKNADLRVGWDTNRKANDNSRRVAIVQTNYVVVIWLRNAKEAKFITAYIADNDALSKLLNQPKWTVYKKRR